MKRLVTAALIIAVVASVASAVTVSFPVTGSSNLISSRTTLTSGGLVGSGGWSSTGSNTGFDISWDVQQITSGALVGDWIYSYTVTEANGKTCLPDSVCHMLLEVSSSITSSNYCQVLFNPCNVCIVAPKTYSASSSNPNLPSSFNSTNAIELTNISGSTFSFESTHSPMWGSFYAVDSNCSTYVWNSGIGSYPSSGSGPFTNWIPVPDTTATGASPVPEPATMALLGLGLVSLIARRKIARG